MIHFTLVTAQRGVSARALRACMRCSSDPHEGELAGLSAEDCVAVAMHREINPATKAILPSRRPAATRLVSARHGGKCMLASACLLLALPIAHDSLGRVCCLIEPDNPESHVGGRETSRRRCGCQSMTLFPMTWAAFLSVGLRALKRARKATVSRSPGPGSAYDGILQSP